MMFNLNSTVSQAFSSSYLSSAGRYLSNAQQTYFEIQQIYFHASRSLFPGLRTIKCMLNSYRARARTLYIIWWKAKNIASLLQFIYERDSKSCDVHC
jgi:hypothetical protein